MNIRRSILDRHDRFYVSWAARRSFRRKTYARRWRSRDAVPVREQRPRRVARYRRIFSERKSEDSLPRNRDGAESAARAIGYQEIKIRLRSKTSRRFRNRFRFPVEPAAQGSWDRPRN